MDAEASIKPGSLTVEQVDCLVALSYVRSEPVINALIDHCVHGHKKALAASSNGIQPSAFSRAYRAICRTYVLVTRFNNVSPL